MNTAHFCIAFAPLLLFATAVFACAWDEDTIAMERRQFPAALELITGKFLRHSDAYYRWRIADRLPQIERTPEALHLYDDLAVAYDKVGEHDKAISVMLQKAEREPGLYTTEANLGTFYIHAGEYDRGLDHIRHAIEINPDAHFGREIYQQLLVEYMLARSRSSEIRLPLDDAERRFPNERAHGFANFVLEAQQTDLGDEDAEVDRALKGVLGMLRFGRHDSPILLEALGDLLLSKRTNNGGKQLAARAYLKASFEADDAHAQQAYRRMAEESLDTQVIPGTKKLLPLSALEAQFRRELEDAEAWHATVHADETKWIAAGVNVSAAFARKYYENPVVTSNVRYPIVISWQLILIGLLTLLLVVLFAFAVRHRLARINPQT